MIILNIGEATKLRILELCRENNITVNKLATIIRDFFKSNLFDDLEQEVI